MRSSRAITIGRRRRSRKPSAGLPDLTFFVDAALGGVKVADALRRSGLKIIRHDDRFPQGTPDEEWLPQVGAAGWVLLTKDDGHCLRQRGETHAAVGEGRAFIASVSSAGRVKLMMRGPRRQ